MEATDVDNYVRISTHTLTWSVTFFLYNTDTEENFNSHAHVERDGVYSKFKTLGAISTHTLTWSVTMCGTNFGSGAKISTHTLTWSVTLHLLRLNCKNLHFNSHAHVERDH